MFASQNRFSQTKQVLLAIAFAVSAGVAHAEVKIATFAGGCFWCVEKDFDHVPGVVKTISGYTGGKAADPTYKTVTRGGSGHREAVQIHYDSNKVSYAELLEVFWRSVDPTDSGGQFCDRGESYTTAVFYADNAELEAVNKSKAAIDASGKLSKAIATRIEPAAKFYNAEDYHQDYYKKNPIRYNFYRLSCGRDAKVRELWGDEAHRGIRHD